jgi:N-acetylmuramoyl-L-alanine amidase
VCDHVDLRRASVTITAIVVLAIAWLLHAQTPTAASFTVLSRDGRRPLPITTTNGQDFVAVDDLASIFALTVKEDALAGGFTMTARGRSIIAASNQPTVSVNGRVVLLPASVQHAGKRWLVPVEFAQLAIAPLTDQRIQVRRPSRLVIVGDLRVPRIVARVDGPGRLTFDITPATTVSMTSEGARVALKFDSDALDLALPAESAAPIEQVRAGEQANTVAIQLAAGASGVKLTPQSTEPVTRVTFEAQAPATTTGAPAPTTPDATAGRPSSPPPGPAPSPESLTARSGPPTLILDPGHGGEDTGVKTAGGLLEKQLTFDVARRVRMLVETRLGLRVLLTRDGDVAVPLDTRVAFANNHKGDLFLSLHANFAPSATVEGAEVYYLQLDKAGEQARADAARNTVAIPVLGGGTRPLELIPLERAQARHLDASANFANSLATSLGARIPMAPSPVRTVPLRVLEGVNMPAAMVEVAFLSSPAQEKLAASDEFKDKTAQGLYDAIAAFQRRDEGASAR